MKNFNLILHSVATLAVTAFATACSSDSVSEILGGNTQSKAEKVTLVARQPGSNNATRVGFTSAGKGYWQTNDAIGVWSTGDNKFVNFNLTSGAGEASATFTGTVTNGVGQYAVYPYNENHNISGTTLTYSLPEKYTYTSVGQELAPEGKDCNSFNMPMLGTVSDDNVVSFKHLGGVICINIDKMPAESGTVKVTESANQLCGNFTANLSDATPEIATTQSTSNNSVTFVYSGATADASGVFYLPAATGSYNLTIEVSGDKKYYSTTAGVEMTRAKLQVVNITPSYTEGTASSDGSKIINGHKFIDLGLPSGLLWAETNIGAETAYDDGYYYAWGETTPKDRYDTSTYTTLATVTLTYNELYKEYITDSFTYNKYNSTDVKTTLDSEDDAAYVNWGNSCRMPTRGEMEELTNSDNCSWSWVSRINSAGETINCYKVVSNKNNNVIYLPASGFRDGSSLYNRGDYGHYWSSTLLSNDVDRARILHFDSSGYNASICYFYRIYGHPVRPVAEP